MEKLSRSEKETCVTQGWERNLCDPHEKETCVTPEKETCMNPQNPFGILVYVWLSEVHRLWKDKER